MRSIATRRLRWVIGGVIAAAVLCLVAAAVMAAGMPAPDWNGAGLVVLATVVGYHLQFSIRVRGDQRLIFLWCHTAAAVGLVLVPVPWMVLTTAAGWAAATFGPGGLRPVKAIYNTALYTTAAAVAAVVYGAVHHGPLLVTSWTGPATVCLAMLIFSAVVDIGVQGVISVAAERPFAATWREGAAIRALQVATDLTLAVASAVAVVVQPRLLIVAAIIAVILHLGYRSAAVARAERAFGRRLAVTVRAIGGGERDRLSVAGRAVEQATRLLGAESVELVLHGDPPLLVRYSRAGRLWSGSPTGAGRPPGQVAEVYPVGAAEDTLGELRVYLASTAPLEERERSGLGAVAAAVDTALRNAAAHAEVVAMAAAAEHAATHDATTGLPARQLLLEWITAHLAAASGSHADSPMALICLNIKGFAEILGAFSAEAADGLLVHAATQLAAGTGECERLAHIGGDTFAVWIPRARDVDDARRRAGHLLSVLSAPAVVESGPLVLSGVAGLVYTLPWGISGAEQMLRQARSALRSGHRRGEQVTVYRVEDDTRGQSAIVLASELRTALPAGDLELVYQPVLELANAIPVSVEALPHWLHPCRGVLLQAEWMPVLEQSDLVGRYLRWLLEEALEGYRAWYRCGVPVPVAVRLPGPALLDPALPGVVAAALSRAGVSPGQLIIEFSGNGLAVTDVADQVLVELVGHGVGLAVDTAGLSLEQLCRVPASEIKLPGRTTELALWDQETRARVRGIVAFADELGLRVIAQDIPTMEHLSALSGLGVHAGQGPCMSRPRYASEMADALQLAAELLADARDATVITLPVRDQ